MLESTRRQIVWLLAGTLGAWPLGAWALATDKVARLGFLGLASASSHASRLAAFREGLRSLGYTEGKNLTIEFRWADGQYERLPALAAELVRLNVDVLVTHSAGALAAKRATATVPIVVTAVADMLALGLVPNLARPGGNVTGLTFFNPELVAKRLELIKESVPGLARAAILLNPDNPSNPVILQELERTAAALKVKLQRFEARGPGDFERVLAAMVNQQVGAVVIHEDPMLNANARAIAQLAITQRLPSCGSPEFAAAGGLIAYGVNFPEMDRRAAAFVDKILKGARPGDLPVERSTKFTLLVNLKTARAIGLNLPTSVVRRGDEVIE